MGLPIEFRIDAKNSVKRTPQQAKVIRRSKAHLYRPNDYKSKVVRWLTLCVSTWCNFHSGLHTYKNQFDHRVRRQSCDPSHEPWSPPTPQASSSSPEPYSTYRVARQRVLVIYNTKKQLLHSVRSISSMRGQYSVLYAHELMLWRWRWNSIFVVSMGQTSKCRRRLSSSSVTLPAGGPAGRRARGRSGG